MFMRKELEHWTLTHRQDSSVYVLSCLYVSVWCSSCFFIVIYQSTLVSVADSDRRSHLRRKNNSSEQEISVSAHRKAQGEGNKRGVRRDFEPEIRHVEEAYDTPS